MDVFEKIKQASSYRSDVELTKDEFNQLVAKRTPLGMIRKLIIPRMYVTNKAFTYYIKSSLVTRIFFTGKHNVQDKIMIARNIDVENIIDTKVHAKDLACILRINQKKIETMNKVWRCLKLCFKRIARKQIDKNVFKIIFSYLKPSDWKISVPKEMAAANKFVKEYDDYNALKKRTREDFECLERMKKKLKNGFV